MDSTTPAVAASTSSDVPKITLYWLEQSRSHRILWLLEELNVPYELKIFHRRADNMLAPPELKKVHALGKSPVLTVEAAGADKPIVLAESGLITEYLLEHYGRDTPLLPTQWKEGQEGKVAGETEAYLRYKYYMHYAEGSLMSLMLIVFMMLGMKTNSPFFLKPLVNSIVSRIYSLYITPNLNTHFSFLEEQLKTAPVTTTTTTTGPYLCGDHLTGADILMSFPLMACRGRAEMLRPANFPILYAYIDRLEQEAGYKKAVAKIVSLEGKFSSLL
ncbi:MAG: hypothetical protein M1818_006525 [Claussenomyces sp. TS43310]|nr:MAG: hypothetical protein M1818_006525 [Claussenomyces sp. TS43310]